MARLWTCGFELQSAAALMEVLSVTGAPSISTTVHRGGSASLRSNPTAATAFVEQQIDVSGVNGRSYHRLYLRIGALPSATTTVYAVGQSGYFPVALQLTTTGALRLRDAFLSTDVGTASGALATGVWYRIELDVSESGATGTTRAVVAYLDGTDFSGTALISGSTGYSRIRAGVQSTATADIYIDDIAVNNPSGAVQNGLPGPGRVVHLRPAGAGDANGWATAVGGTAGAGNNFTRVSDATTPDDATSYNQTTATGTTTIDDYTVSSPTTAGIGADDTITVVHVGGRIGSDAATAASIVYRLKSQSAGTVSESGTVSVAIAGWRTHKAAMPYIPQLTSYVDPQTGGAWTRARLATAQIGVRGDVSQTTVRRVSALWATVDYQPRTVVALGAARETNAGTAVTAEAPGTPVEDLVDDFADGVVDPAKWPESYGDITETGGRARVPCTPLYAAYASAKEYTLAGSSLSCRVYPAALGGATTEAWSQVLITTITPGTDATIEYNAVADTLAMAVRVAYDDPGYTAIPYDPVDHAYMRIAEDAGSLTWETSPDGATWTVRRTETAPGWVSDPDLQVQLISHRSDGVDDSAEYDDVNLLPGAQTIQVGAAAETADGRAATRAKRAVAGAPYEPEAARSLAVSRTVHLGPAREQASGRSVGHARTVRLGAATAASGARPVGTSKTAGLGPAAEGENAQGLGTAKRAAVDTARSAECAEGLTTAGAVHLQTAGGMEAARPIASAKTTHLAETGEQSTAGPVTTSKLIVLGAAREASAAERVVARFAGGVGTALTAETGQPLATVKRVIMGTARATDAAGPARVRRTLHLGAARTSTTAHSVASSKRLTLGAARTADGGRLLAVRSRTTLGTAHEQDIGHLVRQPFQTRLLRAAREHTNARPLDAVRQRPAEHLTPGTVGSSLTPGIGGPGLTPSTSGPRLAATSTTGG